MYIKSPQIRFKCKFIFINYTLYSLRYNTHDVLYVIVFDSLVILSQLQHSMKDKMVQQKENTFLIMSLIVILFVGAVVHVI